MSTITKQAVQAVADLKSGYTIGHADVAILNELASIALASLEAEGKLSSFVAYQEALGGDFEKVLAENIEELYVPGIPVTPAPVAMKDHQIRELVNELRDIAVKYHGSQQLREHIARTICAAMLQAGNSPVIPNGWKLVPIDPTKDMLRAGQSVVGFWLNTVHCYSKMLAAAPAAPQQEVKSALEHGMRRYAGAMQKLSEGDD